MIRLTLSDGIRTQIPAKDVAYIEPDGKGSMIHPIGGEAVKALQDVRTIEARVRAVLAANSSAETVIDVDEPAEIPRRWRVAPLASEPGKY